MPPRREQAGVARTCFLGPRLVPDGQGRGVRDIKVKGFGLSGRLGGESCSAGVSPAVAGASRSRLTTKPKAWSGGKRTWGRITATRGQDARATAGETPIHRGRLPALRLRDLGFHFCVAHPRKSRGPTKQVRATPAAEVRRKLSFLVRGAAPGDLPGRAGGSPRPRREESAPEKHGGKSPRPVSRNDRLPIS